MRASHLASVVLLVTLSAAAGGQTTAPPPAPFLTIGGNTKELLLDWEPVPGAGIYRVMANSAARGYFEPVGDRIPASRTRMAIPIGVHQQPWSTGRYLVMACNPAGCTRSNEVAPSTETMLNTIGYLKASNTGAHDQLGTQVAMSADGTTMAVAADGEDGDNDTLPDSGAVYIYRRNARTWTQEAILKPASGLPGTRFGGGSPLAFRYMGLSANGSLLVVGAPTRTMSGLANAGVALVFQRAADNSWSEQTQLTSSPMAANDQFGYSVDVSSDGTYIKVSSLYPQGGGGTPAGRTHIWHWTGSAWSYSGAIAPHYATDRCPTTRMSADAKMLVSACVTPATEGRLVISKRSGDNTRLRVADQPYLWRENPNMAVNYDASWLAVHQANEFYPGSVTIYRRDGLGVGGSLKLHRWRRLEPHGLRRVRTFARHQPQRRLHRHRRPGLEREWRGRDGDLDDEPGVARRGADPQTAANREAGAQLHAAAQGVEPGQWRPVWCGGGVWKLGRLLSGGRRAAGRQCGGRHRRQPGQRSGGGCGRGVSVLNLISR